MSNTIDLPFWVYFVLSNLGCSSCLVTDGGRIAVTMFGRRGAFVVKLFTTLLLCLMGIFGLDDTNLFLVYVLFATIWQRELESPARNEVDELDFPRGLVGIGAALLVGLVLIPMF